MNLAKTVFLSSLSTGMKFLSSLVINKVIAIYIGPAGIALIGQFQNFLGIVTTIGNGAINSGVTKYVAEYNGVDDTKKNEVINTAMLMTFIFSLVIGAITFAASSYYSQMILHTREYHFIFKLLGITLILISFNSILLSIINGLKEIKLFIMINILSSIFSLIITSVLTIIFGLSGALLALVIVQSMILLITLPLVIRKMKDSFQLHIKIDQFHIRKLMAFSLMAIVAVIASSLTQIMIRNFLIKTLSIEQAGYVQSVWMISMMYLLVLTTAFSTYYLPRLSELVHSYDLRKEILSGYKITIPFVIVTAFCIYLLRDQIISILFTPEFSEMRSLFAFQLMGDFLKMASWTLAYLMIAKAMTKLYILTEIIFSLSFYGFTILFVQQNGLEGVTHAYALNYFLYLITILIIFRDVIFNKEKKDDSM